MTIQFNYHWNGQDGIKTLSTVEEARLVSLGIARYYTPYMDGGPSDAGARSLEIHPTAGLLSGGAALTPSQAGQARAGMGAAPAILAGSPSKIGTVFIGDSIGANGWLQNLKTAIDDYGPYYYDDGTATGTRFARTEDYGWTAWAQMLTDGGFGPSVNTAIGGQRADEILARVQADVLDYLPKIVCDGCGTNDLIAGATTAEVIDRKAALFAAYRSIGARIIAADIAPRSGFDATMRGRAVQVNRWLHQQAMASQDLVVFPMSTAISDFASATGGVSAARTTDDTHPNNVGAYYGGRILADLVAGSSFLPVRESIWTGDAYGADSANAIIRNSNPGMSFTSGGTAGTGVSGSLADGYTCARLSGTPTVVGSIVERADGRGYSQRLAITFGASGDAIEFGIPSASGRYSAAGRKFGVAAKVEIAAGSADVVNRMILYASAVVGGVTYTTTSMNQQSATRRGNLPCSTGGVRGLMQAPRILVPAASASGFSTQFRIYASGAGTVTLDLSEFRLTQHP